MIQHNTRVMVTTGRYLCERGDVVGRSGPFVVVDLDRGRTLLLLHDEVRFCAERERRQQMLAEVGK